MIGQAVDRRMSDAHVRPTAPTRRLSEAASCGVGDIRRKGRLCKGLAPRSRAHALGTLHSLIEFAIDEAESAFRRGGTWCGPRHHRRHRQASDSSQDAVADRGCCRPQHPRYAGIADPGASIKGGWSTSRLFAREGDPEGVSRCRAGAPGSRSSLGCSAGRRRQPSPGSRFRLARAGVRGGMREAGQVPQGRGGRRPGPSRPRRT